MTDPAAQPDPYSRATPAAELKAPPGTDPSTPWIWAILVIPIVQTLPIFFIDWTSYIEASIADPTGLSASALLFSPAYIALFVLGWAGVGLMIWFAYLDWRELQRRGVPQPFHWAWIFLTFAVSFAVYTIGRAVVAHRRTGTGLSVMWATIGIIVGGFVVGIAVAVSIVQQAVSVISTIPLS
ncbi:hypothetical protein [Microcella sp.]|uniref:hypothetical protein n=1 Tax=Microcella sp. TaxID=1913979 RepID=UPI00391CC4FB